MKITDLRLESLNGIHKRGLDGKMKSFYMVGNSTIEVVFCEKNGDVSSVLVNGISFPLDNMEMLEQLNAKLRKAHKISNSIKFYDLKLYCFTGITKREPDGTIDTFYMIGSNIIRVRYSEKTAIVSSLVVNGTSVSLNDSDAIEKLNNVLSTELKKEQTRKGVRG